MTRDEARQQIRENWRDFYQEDRGRGRNAGIICPLCGSGDGHNGTGITENPRKPGQLKCWACNFQGDILDLIQQHQHMDYNTALRWAAEQQGIKIDPYRPQSGYLSDAERTEGEIHTSAEESQQEAAQGQEKPNLIAYYQECRQRLRESQEAQSYLQARGISVDTALSFWIGYDPAADPANPEQKKHPCKRIILPTSPTHYVARSIQSDTGKQFQKMNNKGGTPSIFNERALYDESVKTVFVVEGIFDALSIIEVGAAAVALNSTSNADKLIKRLEERPTQASLIICMDNDGKAGTAQAVHTLKEGMERLKVNYAIANISGEYKDANEALVEYRSSFESAVAEAQRRVSDRPDNVTAYIDDLMQSDIDRFMEAGERKTGYKNLDEKTGGLYSGLYVLAAISSLGKTTFAHQMADQLAAAGHDVIFFSLEQSRLELVSKSLTRTLAQRDPRSEITSLSLRRGYNEKDRAAAAAEYKKQIGNRLSIIEGNFGCDTGFVCSYVRQYVQRTGTRPIVVVDYLQILQPEQTGSGRTQTIREMVDQTVTSLKRLSRDLDLTVIVISSVNRGNYLMPIDFESLKESGGIEYSADVIFGLQLHCISANKEFDSDQKTKAKRDIVREAKKEMPRKIDLVCLKNRYGISSFTCNFSYYPAQDLFIPAKLSDWGERDEEEAFGKIGKKK